MHGSEGKGVNFVHVWPSKHTNSGSLRYLLLYIAKNVCLQQSLIVIKL